MEAEPVQKRRERKQEQYRKHRDEQIDWQWRVAIRWSLVNLQKEDC